MGQVRAAVSIMGEGDLKRKEKKVQKRILPEDRRKINDVEQEM